MEPVRAWSDDKQTADAIENVISTRSGIRVGARFLDQSESQGNQKQCLISAITFDTVMKNFHFLPQSLSILLNLSQTRQHFSE